MRVLRNSAVNLLRPAFIHATRRSLGPEAAHSVFYMDGHRATGRAHQNFLMIRSPGSQGWGFLSS
jgi:hypothetical protein